MRWTRKLQTAGIVLAVGWPLGLAVGAFSLTVTGQRTYMSKVVRYDPVLAWIGPAVIEGTLVAALLSLLLIGLSGWRRTWVWTTLILSSAASVVGNVVVATTEHLPGVAVVTRGTWPGWVILCETVSVIVVRTLWPELRRVDTLPKRDPGQALADYDTGGWLPSENDPQDSDTADVNPTPSAVPPSLHIVDGASSRDFGQDLLGTFSTPKASARPPVDTGWVKMTGETKSEQRQESKDRGELTRLILAELDADPPRWPTPADGADTIASMLGVSVKTVIRERDRIAKLRRGESVTFEANATPPAPPTPPENSETPDGQDQGA